MGLWGSGAAVAPGEGGGRTSSELRMQAVPAPKVAFSSDRVVRCNSATNAARGSGLLLAVSLSLYCLIFCIPALVLLCGSGGSGASLPEHGGIVRGGGACHLLGHRRHPP